MASGVIIAYKAAPLKFGAGDADNDPMNWLDIVLLLLIAGIALAGAKRGFGRTVLDALGLYAALCLASLLAPLLAAHLSLVAGGVGENKSVLFGVLFVGFAGLALAVSWYGHSITNFEAGMFDKLLGLTAGIAAGAIVAHSLVAALVLADPRRTASAEPVRTGIVAPELYSFSGYHAAMDTVTGASSYRRELVDVGGK